MSSTAIWHGLRVVTDFFRNSIQSRRLLDLPASRSSVFPLSNLDSGGNRAQPSQGLHPRRSRNRQRMGTALREVDGIRILHDGCLRNRTESQYQSTGNRENRSQDRETAARRSGTPVQDLFPQRRGSLLARHVPSYSAFCFFPIGNNRLSTS